MITPKPKRATRNGSKRTVGKEEAVVTLLLDIVVPGHHGELDAGRHERSYDVVPAAVAFSITILSFNG